MRDLQPLHTPATPDRSLVMSRLGVRVRSSALYSEVTRASNGKSNLHRNIGGVEEIPNDSVPASGPVGDGYRVTLAVPAHSGVIGAAVIESPREMVASAVWRSGSLG
jgi:hypothetical protein